MVIDNYVKRWCYEEYELKDEDFFTQHANYTVHSAWHRGAIKHGIMALIISMCYSVFTKAVAYNFLVMLAIMTISFLVYGMRKYGANNDVTSILVYFTSLITLVISRKHISTSAQWIFAIAGLIVFVYITIIRPIKFSKIRAKIKKDMKAMEQREEDEDRQFHQNWEAEYKSYREGLPKFETSDDDPDMIKARNLFAGFEGSIDTLKKRYRKLAKEAHPDNGGDEHMFACIVDVYEELKSRL